MLPINFNSRACCYIRSIQARVICCACNPFCCGGCRIVTQCANPDRDRALSASPERRQRSWSSDHLTSSMEIYMKALLVSTPVMGHLNPLLSVGRILISDGHEVVGLSSTYLRDRIEAIGATFRGFLPEADFDIRNASEQFAELKATPPGPKLLRMILERAFVAFMLPQYPSIKEVMREFPFDIIIGDH